MSTSAYILFGFAVVWCFFWTARASKSWLLPLVLVGFGGLHWMLVTSGFYRDTVAFPPPQMALMAPMVLGLVVLLVLPSGRRWLRGADLIALTTLHILRVPVELVLHDAYQNGLVPRSMTYSGHNFDIITGLSAAFLVAWLFSKRGPGKQLLVAWNILGLTLLAVVVITAVLSIPSSVQRLAFDQPNLLVVSTPWVLLPAMLVPAVLWAHVAALVKLLGKGGSEAV